MARTAEATGTVIVSRRQLVTFFGRTLASVELTPEGLRVTKKRDRGGRYDTHTFPLAHVVAFVEGDGGRREPAYATVMTHTVIRKISGEVSYEEGWTIVTDAEGNMHHFRAMNDVEVVVVEDAEKPDRGTSRRTKSKKAKPAAKARRTRDEELDEDEEGDEEADDGSDEEGDEEAEDGDDTEEGDDDDLDEESDDAEDGDDSYEDDDEPPAKPKKGAAKKPAPKKPAGKAKPAPKGGKAGRRVSSF